MMEPFGSRLVRDFPGRAGRPLLWLASLLLALQPARVPDVRAAPALECRQPSTDGCLIAFDSPVSAILGQVAQRHTWRLNLLERRVFTAVLSDLQADLDLRLYGPDGSLVASSLTVGMRAERATALDAEPGEYRLVVNSPSGQAGGAAYSLRASLAREVAPETAGELAELARIGLGELRGAAYSPDGRLVAVASSLGVYLYDALLGEARLIEMEDGAVGAAFMPDGQTLAVMESGPTIHLLSLADGSVVESLKAKQGGSRLAVSPDGQTIGHLLPFGVRLWRRAEADTTSAFQASGEPGVASSLAFSPDGQLVAVGFGSGDGSVRVWRVADGALLHTLVGHENVVEALVFSPDGQVLVSGSWDHTVRLWRIADGASLGTFGEHPERISSLAFAPDGRTLAIGLDDNTVGLWNVESQERRLVLEGHTSAPRVLAFAPSGEELLSSALGEVGRWRVADGALLTALASEVTPSTAPVFLPDGRSVAVGTWRGAVLRWKLADRSPLLALRGHVSPVTGVAASPDGELLASSSLEGQVQLWRLTDLTLLRRLGFIEALFDVAFAPDGRTLAAGGYWGNVRLWRVDDGVEIRRLSPGDDRVDLHDRAAERLAFAPDGQTLAVGYRNGPVRVFRLSDGALVHALADQPVRGNRREPRKVNGLAYSLDGRLLASASDDETVRLWRMPGAAPHLVLGEPRAHSWHGVAFSPGGQLVASGSGDGRVRLWRVADGAIVSTFRAHDRGVEGLGFSPDGRTLATSAWDGTIRFWGTP